MENTLKSVYWWKNMQEDIALYVKTCRDCQVCKKTRKKYGHLTTQRCGSYCSVEQGQRRSDWSIEYQDKCKKLFVLNALTMINPATRWIKIAEIKERTAEHLAKVFDNVWLSRYPRPQYIGFDNGGENKGLFQQMIVNYGQKSKPTSTHNPQSNVANPSLLKNRNGCQ
jgi:Integrase zinc binding domain